jgi:hypothetical protein
MGQKNLKTLKKKKKKKKKDIVYMANTQQCEFNSFTCTGG